MNVTQFKDGCKSVKMLSLNELIENMRDSGTGKPVVGFREKLQEYSPGYPCPHRPSSLVSFSAPGSGRRKE